MPRTALIWACVSDYAHMGKFDELFHSEVDARGNEWYWLEAQTNYVGRGRQKHWLTYNSQTVPVSNRTSWKYHINPISVYNTNSRDWRLAGAEGVEHNGLYDIGNHDYQIAVTEAAIRHAKHITKYHGGAITGIFWDSIISEWWWDKPAPPGFDLAKYRADQAAFCDCTAEICHREGFEVGANVAHCTLDWPGSLDYVWIEHCTLDKPVPEVLTDNRRKFRVGIHIELVSESDPRSDGMVPEIQRDVLHERYVPLLMEGDMLVYSGADSYWRLAP